MTKNLRLALALILMPGAAAQTEAQPQAASQPWRVEIVIVMPASPVADVTAEPGEAAARGNIHADPLAPIAAALLDPGVTPHDGSVRCAILTYGGGARDVPMFTVGAEGAVREADALRARASRQDSIGVLSAPQPRAPRSLAEAMLGVCGLAREPGWFRHVLVIVDTPPVSWDDVRMARDELMSCDATDQINALGVGVPRADLLTHLAESDIDFPSGWSGSTLVPPERADLSMAAETVDSLGSTGFQDLLARMLTRMAHCYGDYDLDGVVEFTFGGSCFGCTTTGLAPCGEDWTKFLADSVGQTEYADWNFDVDWNGNLGSNIPVIPGLFGVDFSKFFTGALGGCP